MSMTMCTCYPFSTLVFTKGYLFTKSKLKILFNPFSIPHFLPKSRKWHKNSMNGKTGSSKPTEPPNQQANKAIYKAILLYFGVGFVVGVRNLDVGSILYNTGRLIFSNNYSPFFRPIPFLYITGSQFSTFNKTRVVLSLNRIADEQNS